ncbi:site-specific DNA-methyltransferase [Luteimonas sp. MC1782]|uniref:site-specific DNA-methyltransferase n=1 Tax=Luteimonas sp. MC1782 TaxID=2760305 RepID=UPI001602A0A3|nr:site-specific DNA-methyltransferase [Luteimonas sp. MC1782]MBB1472596.1 site-specific DNA-methyltransferase [Luteimonas sp. MC1782]
MAIKRTKATSRNQATDYLHSQEATQRPDVGVQDQFQSKKPPKTYRFDSSLDPALSWDENRERELAEWLIGLVQRCASEGEANVFGEAQVWAGGSVQVQSLGAAANLLQTLSQPFLNWAGKAERHQIEVPTVPLFVHERHSTKAILEGIKNRKAKGTSLDLFGDGGLDVTDKLDAYEHKGPWQNRMMLGDSLQIMNSMLEFEGLGGQVQMVYMDPPYGVKFGSNFQPFVRSKQVKHAVDAEMTREPEMVRAYRDTWELGLHSYLTYLRDRLLLAKELLSETGSIFVQISDENLHHVREILDEVFGAENAISIITFSKTASTASNLLSSESDFLLWYAKDKKRAKYRQLYLPKEQTTFKSYKYAVAPDSSTVRLISKEEREGSSPLPEGWRLAQLSFAVSQDAGKPEERFYTFNGKRYDCGAHRHWKTTNPSGLDRLAEAKRLIGLASQLNYIRYLADFPVTPLTNSWSDTGSAGYSSSDPKVYVVQTDRLVIQRCMLMTTDPGDLVFDPTCGSGSTAYVAEQWGRRWITCDTSRVPLALARQRLLTATFPYYELKEPQLGPQGGFVYQRKQNRNGEEVGGLVPHTTLQSIANEAPPATEVISDRPEVKKSIVRVSGPFVVEATIAPAQGRSSMTGQFEDGIGEELASYSDAATHIERMTQVLRQSRTLRLPGNRELSLADIRRVTDGEYLHAEGQDSDGNKIAVVFGPQDGAISSSVVYEAAREAYFLKFTRLYFFGFAINAKARELLEDHKKLRIPSTYVSVTPDVAMSDLLKTSRASEIFSITGLPDAVVRKTGKENDDGAALYEVELKGLDVFNPSTMEQEAIEGQNMPAWMLDTDYNGMSFYATQVFFPKTSAWDNLKKSLKVDFDESVWAHLAGTISEPFVPGETKRVAVKVIDERGNELMRVLEVAV